MQPAAAAAPRRVGRYAMYGAIASGGMATVHFGRLVGPGGFTRTVAIKRLHPHLSSDAAFVGMFLDEARLAARIRHPNVVPTIDVINEGGEIFVVMDYVHGESAAQLVKAAQRDGAPIPVPVVAAIVCGVLHGLHAAHEAKSDRGEPLAIVHRDVSPQNVLVGADGVPRVLDFGVAKAKGRLHTTESGQVKGKFGYMSPEQLRGLAVDRRTDVYAAGVVLWELLTLRRLFGGESDGEVVTQVLEGEVRPPSDVAPGMPKALDAVCLKALARDPTRRFDTARQMAAAIEAATQSASATVVGEWVEGLVGDAIHARGESLARVEADTAEGKEPGASALSGERAIAHEQPSTISVSRHGADERADGSRVLPWILAVVLLAGGAGAWIAIRRAAPARSPAASATASPSSVSAPTPDPVTPPAPAPPAADPAVAPATSATPGASAPRPRPIPARPRPRPTHSAPTPPPNCNPPYTMDENGVRHYKPECPLD